MLAIAAPTEHSKLWFYFVILFLVVDYGRPQDILHADFLHPGIIGAGLLILCLMCHGKLFQLEVKQVRLIWCFIGLLFLFVPFAANNYFAYVAARDMFFLMPFILSTVICVDSIQRLRKIIFIIVCLMIYISCYSLLHRGMGSGSFFQDENDLSLFINMWLPFCAILALGDESGFKRSIYMIGLVVGIIANVNSFSRGGFVGMVAIAFIGWIYSSKKILFLLIVCIAGLALFWFAGEKYVAEMQTVTDTQEGTAVERLESWKAGWKMFVDNPWGVGGNNFQIRFPDYQSDWFQRVMWGRAAHSLWFTLLSELGILGVTIYFLLLYYNVADIFYLQKINSKHNSDLEYLRNISIAFLASMTGYFSSGTFLSVLYYPHYWYLTAIIIAAHRIKKKSLAAINGLDRSEMVQ